MCICEASVAVIEPPEVLSYARRISTYLLKVKSNTYALQGQLSKIAGCRKASRKSVSLTFPSKDGFGRLSSIYLEKLNRDWNENSKARIYMWDSIGRRSLWRVCGYHNPIKAAPFSSPGLAIEAAQQKTMGKHFNVSQSFSFKYLC